jgi:hypothetical protein
MDGTILKFVNDFKYLGSLIADEDADIGARIKKAWEEAKRLRRICVARDITDKHKRGLLSACILSVMLYGSEAWAITERRTSRLSC